VAFAAPYPGKIVALDMAKIGGGLICQKDAFLCAALGTKLSIEFQLRLGAGFFGGEGFILQRLAGDGKAFTFYLLAAGAIIGVAAAAWLGSSSNRKSARDRFAPDFPSSIPSRPAPPRVDATDAEDDGFDLH